MEFLALLNLLLIPAIGYLIRVEHRLTKIETLLNLKVNCKEKEKK